MQADRDRILKDTNENAERTFTKGLAPVIAKKFDDFEVTIRATTDPAKLAELERARACFADYIATRLGAIEATYKSYESWLGRNIRGSIAYPLGLDNSRVNRYIESLKNDLGTIDIATFTARPAADIYQGHHYDEAEFHALFETYTLTWYPFSALDQSGTKAYMHLDGQLRYGFGSIPQTASDQDKALYLEYMYYSFQKSLDQAQG